MIVFSSVSNQTCSNVYQEAMPTREQVVSPTARVLLPPAPDGALPNIPNDLPIFFSDEAPAGQSSGPASPKRGRWAKSSVSKKIGAWKASLRPLFPSKPQPQQPQQPPKPSEKAEESESRRGKLHTGAPPRTPRIEEKDGRETRETRDTRDTQMRSPAPSWTSFPSPASSLNSPTALASTPRSKEKKPTTPSKGSFGFGSAKAGQPCHWIFLSLKLCMFVPFRPTRP